MNISYKWLKEYVDFELTADKVAEALTSIGLEVASLKEVQTVKGGLKGLVVGKVLTCEEHPQSDHLHVCSVDLGKGEPSQIVCGAPNVAAGEKVIVATIGCVLYDSEKEFVIKKSKLRGVQSFGMLCAEDEIGIGNDHDGIIVLPEDTKLGMEAAEYYNVQSDYLIEIDITPNRSDACSHYGVARDLYTWLKANNIPTSLHRPDNKAFKIDNNDLNIDVEVKNTEACPRYCAITVSNCDIKESPEWLKNKLTTIGLHPINNIVDITNYIMFAYGQPLHCFDADKIEGNKIIVETKPNDTSFVTLDGEERKLTDHDLAICNIKEPMCIAGVFGGKGSGTYKDTKNVLFESAYFHPTWIRKSSRYHSMQTDASFRFERGVDPNGQIYALKQAALLAKELTGGKISMEIKDTHSEATPFFPVTLSYEYCDDIIGKKLPRELIKSIVKDLEINIIEETGEYIKLEVPPYRTDVTRPCDVVEDILRIYGYNNIELPTTINSCLSIKGPQDSSNKFQNLISEQLIGCSFNEIMNNSLTKSSYYEGLNVHSPNHLVHLINPLSNDLNVMRQTLLFGGLESIIHNVNRKQTDLLFFEFGNCYHFDANKKNPEKVLAAYSEEMHLGLWITGNRVTNSWAHPNEATTFYELRSYVDNIITRSGIKQGEIIIKQEEENNIFDAELTIRLRNGKLLCALGIVSKSVSKKMGLSQEVYFAEFNWTALMKKSVKYNMSYKELSKFPLVSRDLALLVDKDIEFSQIEEIAFRTEKKLLKKVELFDVYEGKNLPVGKISYAINFILRDDNKTLKDTQIEKTMQNILQQLEKNLKVTLR